VNQFETQAIESILISRGHTAAKPGEGCDACLINTCAVTAESVRKSRQAVRRMRKAEPGALVAVCGCFPQLEPNTAAQLGADIVGGSGNRREFALEIERVLDERISKDGAPAPSSENSETVPAYCYPSLSTVFEELPPGGGSERTRALLKIQDGCDNFCAYCVVPYLRGRVRSLPVARAAAQAKHLDELGFKEIIVTGIEISSYGSDLQGAPPLDVALRAMCAAAPRARFRLGSLDPGALTEGFCNALTEIPNLCNHFHLSLQSGCDDTLRRMGRKHRAEGVHAAIAMLRSRITDCGITADLITGFPGETGSEFRQTMAFIEAARFSNMHIFPFSPRPGTRAADMPEQVEKSVRIERARAAAAAAEKMSRDFALAQTGKVVEVLFERRRGGFWTGHSGNYLEVAVKQGGERNSIYPVKITGIEEGAIWGRII